MYCPSPKPAVQRLRMLDPPGSASMQVPGRGGLHGHHPGHAVQACAIPPGTLVGAQRDRGAQRRGPQGHTRPRGAQRWGVTAGETDRGTDQEVSPWVRRVHPSVPPLSCEASVGKGSRAPGLCRPLPSENMWARLFQTPLSLHCGIPNLYWVTCAHAPTALPQCW